MTKCLKFKCPEYISNDLIKIFSKILWGAFQNNECLMLKNQPVYISGTLMMMNTL